MFTISHKYIHPWLSVKIDGHISSELELSLGTPQGSRLSPLLFSIIMADLDLWVNKSFLSNFADDTQTCVIANTPEELKEITSEESKAVLNFFSGINLLNNPSKAALIVNSKGSACKMSIDDIGGKTLESKDNEKLLGLRINSSLDWKSHINYLTSTLNQRTAMLKRIKQRVPIETLKTIADAIWNSKLRYGIAVYYKPRLTNNDEKCTIQEPLQVLQNDMIRELFGYKRKDRVNMDSLRAAQKMLSVNQIACYHILLETFNILVKNSSPQIKEKIKHRENTRYDMRSNEKGDLNVIEKPKKSCVGFTYLSSKLWNMLPEEYRKITSPELFKSKIKTWIIESEIPS